MSWCKKPRGMSEEEKRALQIRKIVYSLKEATERFMELTQAVADLVKEVNILIPAAADAMGRALAEINILKTQNSPILAEQIEGVATTLGKVIADLNKFEPIVLPTAGTLAVVVAPLPSGTVGSDYSAVLNVTGGTGPFNFTATGLPAGLTLNAATGAISGVPTVAGTNSVDVTVTDSSSPQNTAIATLSLVVS